MLISEPLGPGDLDAVACDAAAVYLMLHGSSEDATAFWGEQTDGVIKAFRAIDVPPSTGAIVFAGCCWGALTVNETAALSDGAVTPRGISQSIALSFLAAGARAFIGCTGTHYSPSDPPYSYFGGPMHSAFWRAIAMGDAPAKALFSAKTAYIKQMPHGRVTPAEVAIEYKTLRQFTCLGLGW